MHLFLRSAQLLSSHSRFILSNHARLFVNSGSRFVSIHQQPLLFQTLPLGSFSQICCRSWSFYAVRGFHTSQPRSAAPLAVLLVKLAGPLSKLTKLVAVVGGRYFRKWWNNLSADKRLQLTKAFHLRKERLTIVVGGFGGLCIAYYFFHLEETPFTHRPRFMPISHKQMEELTSTEYRNTLELYADKILPVTHPNHLRVFRVAKRLVMANGSKEMEHLSWQVNVVNCDDMNAFVLPNGQIFMFSGMLKVLPNDDSLATILGHEMSHAILQHGAEQVSLCGFINMFIVIVLALLWALLPTEAAIFAHWFQNRILSIFLHLPYSRKLEEEADEVGMNMAAKACFDVRESPRFWRRLANTQNEMDEPELLKWLSTHPKHRDRADNLEALLPQALEVRRNCNCPPLSGEASFITQEDKNYHGFLQQHLLPGKPSSLIERNKFITK
ncbi:metalloendopeptidase OMA1, mitochondrial-like [Stylophora pistillata]|uniref:Metalloendopeptidase OMA1, mitochondrial n=1 Tax=Stylophora pistillata TaxID=50429 RepID=A0A2B4SQD8_STYPI|nr:metalloendopeptidase OMA1, mitochondrial-like [Stylophora pistillata]PFX30818.1 Metalloendopeptidase OMA1, mitochondrial [Stylophora pistillata]